MEKWASQANVLVVVAIPRLSPSYGAKGSSVLFKLCRATPQAVVAALELANCIQVHALDTVLIDLSIPQSNVMDWRGKKNLVCLKPEKLDAPSFDDK